MSRPIIAGVAYFGGIFAAGFVLGTIRIMLLVPELGRWCASVIELPVILGISWIFCGWLLRRFSVASKPKTRLLMGSVALGLLMGAEVLLGLGLFGRNFDEQVHDMTSGPGLLGLLGQIAFAAVPLAMLQRAKEGHSVI